MVVNQSNIDTLKHKTLKSTTANSRQRSADLKRYKSRYSSDSSYLLINLFLVHKKISSFFISLVDAVSKNTNVATERIVKLRLTSLYKSTNYKGAMLHRLQLPRGHWSNVQRGARPATKAPSFFSSED